MLLMKATVQSVTNSSKITKKTPRKFDDFSKGDFQTSIEINFDRQIYEAWRHQVQNYCRFHHATYDQ